MSQYNVVPVHNFNHLWQMFIEYHREVSLYAGEMPLPSKSEFLYFWQQANKWTYFLTLNNKPIGFVLIQIVEKKEKNIVELGAIFVIKKFRSIHSLKLYQTALNCAKQNKLALESEIAIDNTHSMNIYYLLKKKYSTNIKLAFKEQETAAGRISVSCCAL